MGVGLRVCERGVEALGGRNMLDISAVHGGKKTGP